MTVDQARALLAPFGVRPRRRVMIHELHDHVVQIARESGVTIVWSAKYACARPARRRIELPGARITDVVGYCEALHELGHVLGDRGRTINAREHAAWAWARRTAMFWNDDMTAAMTQYLGSYYMRRSRRVELCYGNTIARRRLQLAAAMQPVGLVER